MSSSNMALQPALAHISTADMRNELRRRTGLVRKSVVAKKLREGRRKPQSISEKAREMNNMPEEILSVAPSNEAVKRAQMMLIIANFMFPRGPLTVAMNRLGAQPRRKSLNSFMAFRSFYSTNFTSMQQKEISGILKTIWESEPFKDRWAVIAEAYTLMRDLNGIHNAPLKDFAIAVSRFVGVIQPDEYLATLGWELIEEDGIKSVVKCFEPDLNNLNEYMKNAHRDVTQAVAFCYEQGLYNAAMFQTTNGKKFQQMRNIQKQQQAMTAASPIDALPTPTLEEFFAHGEVDKEDSGNTANIPQVLTTDVQVMSMFGGYDLDAQAQDHQNPLAAPVTVTTAQCNGPEQNTSSANECDNGTNKVYTDGTVGENDLLEGLTDFNVGGNLVVDGTNYLRFNADGTLMANDLQGDNTTVSEGHPAISSLGQEIPLNLHFHPDTTLDVIYDPQAGDPFQAFDSWDFGNLEAIAAFNTRFVPATEEANSYSGHQTDFDVDFDEFLAFDN